MEIIYPLLHTTTTWETLDSANDAVPHSKIRIEHFGRNPIGLVICVTDFPVVFDPLWHGRGTHTYQVVEFPNGAVQRTRDGQPADSVQSPGGLGICPIVASTPASTLGTVAALSVVQIEGSQPAHATPPPPKWSHCSHTAYGKSATGQRDQHPGNQ